MKRIVDAITSLYDGAGGATLRALSNGLFFGDEPGRVDPPFVQVTILSGGSADHSFGPTEHGNTLVLIEAYSVAEDRTQIDALEAAVLGLFNFASLSATGWTFFDCVKVTEGSDGSEGNWRYSVTYEILSGK